ncbi:TonB-dependent receptor [Obesumbacterium proteus]|uniref:TonB-dependent receptor n=1 Tax=Obesumbacterium proteus TaxID=82983 RepID=UPI000AEA663C|nr:TonB-dependent siderophore receptor [Obesumbacterium proteus]
MKEVIASVPLLLTVAAIAPSYAMANTATTPENKDLQSLQAITVTATPESADPSLAKNKAASLGPLGVRKLQDTPYSVHVMSNNVITEQQMTSLKDILSYFPSVQGTGVRPQSRGMQGSVVQNSLLDGLNIVSTTEYPAEQFENVQVLNGLAGSLFGPANPAGMFNFVSKRPTANMQGRVTTGVRTGTAYFNSLDIGGPIGFDDRLQTRLTVLDEHGDSYGAESKKRRQFVGLATDFHFNENTVLESNFSYYNYLLKGNPANFALAPGVSFPSGLNPKHSHYGQDFAGDNDTTYTGSVHLKHTFDNDWKLHLGFLRQIADRESTAVTNTLLNNQGDYISTVSNTTASRFTISSYLADVNGTVWTKDWRHDLTLGYRGFDWKNYNPIDGTKTTLGTGSLSHPSEFEKPDFPDFTHRYHSATSTQNAFVLGDTLTFNPQLSMMLTGSQNYLNTSNYAKTGKQTSDSSDSGFSKSVSLIYKPVDILTLYTTYADSLQQGDTAPSGANNQGSILSPYRSEQYEVGAKVAVNRLNLSLAAFQIKRPYAYVQTNGDFAEEGEQRNRGLEFVADGNLTDDLRIFGGVTYLDPKLRNSANSATENKQIVGLPKMSANMLVEYQLPWISGLGMNMNVHYTGRRPTANDNSSWVGSYSTVDLGTSYQMPLAQTQLTWRVGVTNVTNRRYWDNIVPGALTGYTGTGSASAQMGAPRMAYASLQVDF